MCCLLSKKLDNDNAGNNYLTRAYSAVWDTCPFLLECHMDFVIKFEQLALNLCSLTKLIHRNISWLGPSRTWGTQFWGPCNWWNNPAACSTTIATSSPCTTNCSCFKLVAFQTILMDKIMHAYCRFEEDNLQLNSLLLRLSLRKLNNIIYSYNRPATLYWIEMVGNHYFKFMNNIILHLLFLISLSLEKGKCSYITHWGLVQW